MVVQVGNPDCQIARWPPSSISRAFTILRSNIVLVWSTETLTPLQEGYAAAAGIAILSNRKRTMHQLRLSLGSFLHPKAKTPPQKFNTHEVDVAMGSKSDVRASQLAYEDLKKIIVWKES